MSPLGPTESLVALKVIGSADTDSIPGISSVMIEEMRPSEAWYRSTWPMGWCALTGTFCTVISILVAYCLDFRAINCLPASDEMKSGRPRYVMIQQQRICFQSGFAEMLLNHLPAWKRIASSTIWNDDAEWLGWHHDPPDRWMILWRRTYWWLAE